MFNKTIRTRLNLVIKESINSFRKDNNDDLLDNSKYDTIYQFDYGQKELKSGKQDAQKEPLKATNSKYRCSICDGPAESVRNMPGFFCCEACKKIVNPIKN